MVSRSAPGGCALGLTRYRPRSSGDRAPPSGGGGAGSNPAGGTDPGNVQTFAASPASAVAASEVAPDLVAGMRNVGVMLARLATSIFTVIACSSACMASGTAASMSRRIRSRNAVRCSAVGRTVAGVSSMSSPSSSRRCRSSAAFRERASTRGAQVVSGMVLFSNADRYRSIAALAFAISASTPASSVWRAACWARVSSWASPRAASIRSVLARVSSIDSSTPCSTWSAGRRSPAQVSVP
jgi:hypothetical protein